MLFRGKKWFSLHLATKFTTLAPEVVAPVPATKLVTCSPGIAGVVVLNLVPQL